MHMSSTKWAMSPPSNRMLFESTIGHFYPMVDSLDPQGSMILPKEAAMIRKCYAKSYVFKEGISGRFLNILLKALNYP